MKAYYILFLLLLPTLSYTQDLSLLKLTEKYNYQADSLNHISHTIWVDSFQVMNEKDTLFFLNRVVKNIPHPTDHYLFWKTNQGQFLGKTVLRTEEINYYFQNDQDTFLLMPNSPIGTTWEFESKQRILATVTIIESQETFGLEDSVKTIRLSTNHEIQISKRFGLLSFASPYENATYELKGLKIQQIGVQVPDFWDIYSFEEGDVLMHLEERSINTGDLSSGRGEVYIKREIIDKKIVVDTLIFFFKAQEKEIWYPLSGPPGTAYRHYEDSLRLVNDADHPANKFNGELVKNYLGSEEPLYSSDVCYINFVRFLENPEFNAFSKQINFHPWLESEYGNWFNGGYILTDTSEYLIPEFFCNQYSEWSMNIGKANSYFWCHEVSNSEAFLGYTDGMDTIGIIMSDIFFTSTQEVLPKVEFKIMPNPSSDYIQIENSPARATIEIYDTNAKLRISSQNSQPDISNLASGIYFLVVKFEDEVIWVDRFVKSDP